MISNIVLVHGAFADGSSWRHVIQLLQARRYHVTAVQQPLTSLEEDVAITRHVLSLHDGPCILVGHSYGGMIITEAGHEPNVAGLVYIAAFAPDEGENLTDLKAMTPPAAGAAHVHVDELGYAWIDPAHFAEVFAADVELHEARVMSAVQMPWRVPKTRSGPPAWRQRPSWFQISEQDQMIRPELQHLMAERMGAVTTCLDTCHAAPVSRPQQVAAVIMEAAQSARTYLSTPPPPVARSVGQAHGALGVGDGGRT